MRLSVLVTMGIRSPELKVRMVTSALRPWVMATFMRPTSPPPSVRLVGRKVLVTQPLPEMISMIFFIAWQCVAHVGTIAFARIDIATLKKIIRKTYAAEILFGIVLLIVAFSLVLPHLEEGITTFSDALWYCFAIVTTIGFGDFSAVTPVGRILSVILGLYGIIVVALITSIIVNFYGEMKSDDDED